VASGVSTDPAIIRWGRRALIMIGAGLLLQLGATFSWSPGTFIVSAAVGLPLVVQGAAIFGWVVLRASLRQGAPWDGPS
jgi:hypothetical protein